MKRALYFLIIIGILLLFKVNTTLPDTKVVTISSLPLSYTSYLLPLDSRPVCTNFPVKLARLSGTHLILPPKELLDNYRQPGDTEKLFAWLQTAVQTKPQNIYLSSDMLLYGGLIASRQHTLTLEQQYQKLYRLKTLTESSPSAFQIFSLIPRLLVSDELIPDRWYKYRLFRYSQFYHQAMVTGEYIPAFKQQEYANAIPPEILNKYHSLFTNSYLLNKYLLQYSNNQLEVILGQDDGHPWGLPTYTAELLEHQLVSLSKDKGHITYGADEIASCLVAKNYLRRQNKSPKFYIQYADTSLPNLYMPYLAATIDAVLQEKLKLLGASYTEKKQEADIILYVSCGHDTYRPNLQQAKQLQELLSTHKNVALIDLTANFETSELLLPHLLHHNIPLNQLIAYSGWNTFSNSAGTALAQAVIMWGRKQELRQPSDLLSLHTLNLQILIEQILDNYYYQKEYHAQLKKNLLWRGIDPTSLDTKDKAVAEAFIRQFIKLKGRELLNSNLGKHPFYSDSTGKYYLKNFSVAIQLPWHRIFEIDVQLKELKIGCQRK